MIDFLSFSPKEVAEVLGVRDTTLAGFRSKGMPMRSFGKYDIVAVVAWYVGYRIELTTKPAKQRNAKVKTHSKTATERLEEAKADKIERENAVAEGKLLDIEDVEAIISDMAITVAGAFEAIGPRLAPILAGIDEPAEIQSEIRREAHLTRGVMAKKLKKRGISVLNEG